MSGSRNPRLITPNVYKPGEPTLEQIYTQQSAGWLAGLAISGYLLQNLVTNWFSLYGSCDGTLPLEAIITLFGIGAVGTWIANFIAKTIVAVDPLDAIKPSTAWRHLYDRVGRLIKANKSEYVKSLEAEEKRRLEEEKKLHPEEDEHLEDTSPENNNENSESDHDNADHPSPVSEHEDVAAENKTPEAQPDKTEKKSKPKVNLVLALDDAENEELKTNEDSKLRVLLQLLADKHQVNIEVKTSVEALSMPDKTKMLFGVGPQTNIFSSHVLMDKLSSHQKFNYHSHLEGNTSGEQFRNLLLKVFLIWPFIKGLPAFVLVNQGITTIADSFNRFAGFNTLAWYIQLGLISFFDAWLIPARVFINNLLKSLSAQIQIAGLPGDIRRIYNNTERMVVNPLKAFLVILGGLASVGFTTWYHFATAYFYSPHQTVEKIQKMLELIPGIEDAPDWLKSIAGFIVALLPILYYGQIFANVALNFLTSCKSTLDKIMEWLYKKPDQTHQEKSWMQIVFLVALVIDSLTFAVNAGFNSQNTVALLWLSILTGLGIFVTSNAWGHDTQNLPRAGALVRKFVDSWCGCCSQRDQNSYRALSEGAGVFGGAAARGNLLTPVAGEAHIVSVQDLPDDNTTPLLIR